MNIFLLVTQNPILANCENLFLIKTGEHQAAKAALQSGAWTLELGCFKF